jgi:phosphate acetyltransferase
MPRTLLVVPTGHGVGLTATCLGLVNALDRQGVAVGFLKPVAQPGEGSAEPERSTALVRLVTSLEPPEPLAAAHAEALLSTNNLDDLMEEIVGAAEDVLATHDVVIVEGLVPSPALVYSGRVNLALAKALDADVVLVGAPGGAGADGDAEVAEAMAIAATSYRVGEEVRVVGCIVNRLRDTSPERLDTLRAALGRHGLTLVGAVPFEPELTRPRILDLAHALGARALNEGEWASRRFRDVAVCAQSVPGVLAALEEGRLIVTPGDRHDVIMAACLAALNGTRLAALLLTVGLEPDPAVWRLTQAAAATGLPILLTDEPTYETATRVHDLDPEVPIDDAQRAEAVMRTVAEHLDEAWLATVPQEAHAPRLSPAAFRFRLTKLARAAGRRIVLPEGSEPRTVQAAAICEERGIARCTLLAPREEVEAVARGLGLTLPPGLTTVDPATVAEPFVQPLVELRRHKGMTEAVAREHLANPVVLGTMMLQRGEVDGLVSGATHTTADTIRPALQLIRTRPGASLVSSIFFMCLPDEVVIYGDCAVNPDPDAAQLADIALQSADSARAFGIEPRVAMISYSTGTSGSGSEVEKVAEATRLARERAPDLAIDGPLQYDAAAIASVARSKRPDSQVAGRATVFIFPDLNTGNTTYKAVQRGADVVSIGPMLQGLARPVNDLSRGALVDDIVYTIALTAIQAAAVDDAAGPVSETVAVT